MKKNLLAMTALAAMLFAGCTSSDELTTLESIKQAENAPTPISFGTYMGRTGTRAGYEGDMTTDKLKTTATTDGFGVFGFYTGTDTYAQYQHTTYSAVTGGTSSANHYPNFMYNQQVSWSTDHWTYSPVKYWPNEVSTTSDDDQNNNTSDYPSYTDGNNGGNLSFFAYAPYIPLTQGTPANIDGANPGGGAKGSGGTTDGITHISGNQYLGDPIITYVIPSDLNSSVSTGAYVDLLWGTSDGTSVNVLSTGNTGVTGTGTQGTPTTQYSTTLLNGYKTNADLTKQKTDGTVGFAFKHALASIGGASTNPSDVNANGFLVKLDIDNAGAETGGSRERYNSTGWRTIVTIKDIEITNDLDGDGLIDGSDVSLGGKDYTEVGLPNTGTFNLATGQWTPTNPVVLGQKIGTNIGSATTYNAVLNTKIAEVYDKSGAQSTWFAEETTSTVSNYFEGTLTENNTKNHPGVMEDALTVYNNPDQNPFILIPGTTPTFRVTVDYVVRTYDANLYGECTTVNQKISKIISFTNPIELNKHYNIIMHLGLTGVKFTATVSDWVDAAIGDSNNDGTPDNDVYLPINVAP